MRTQAIVPALIVMGALLAGAPPASAQNSCTVVGGGAGGDVFECQYNGQPPTATFNAAVVAGTVDFFWQCGTKVPVFSPLGPGSMTSTSRVRAGTEICLVIAQVTLGPASFTATGT